jgi:hypothetical protein
MQDKIDQLLKELYSYDPQFMKHEKDLKEILAQLLAIKPETKFDPAFAENLRHKLMAKADLMTEEKTHKPNFSWLKILAPAALVAVALFAAGQYYLKPQTASEQVAFFNQKAELKQVEQQAFGSLSQTQPLAYGRGGGGGGGSSAALAPETTAQTNETDTKMAAPGMGGGSDAMIYPPDFVNYKFVYKGEPLTLESQTVSVLKRVKELPKGTNFGRIISSLSTDLVNLKSFTSTFLENIALSEDKDFGYTININFREGSIGINENWTKWNTPDRQCQTPECYESFKLKAEQVPADNVILGIAEQFLTDHGIQKDNYGTPYVNNQWREDYLRSTDRSAVYIPDVVSVMYPLQINGQTVYDEGGFPTGLQVSVNVRQNKVSGLWELTSQNYQSSSYQAETDTAKILKLAEQGGFRYGYYPMPANDANIRTQELELQTPTQGLVKIYHSKGTETMEIYAPSLIFPVKDAEKYPYMRRAIRAASATAPN